MIFSYALSSWMVWTVCWCTASNDADKKMTFMDYSCFLFAEMIIIYLYVLVTFSSFGSINTFYKAAISSTFYQNLYKLKQQNTEWWWYGWVAIGGIRYVLENLYLMNVEVVTFKFSYASTNTSFMWEKEICWFESWSVTSIWNHWRFPRTLSMSYFCWVFHYLSLQPWVQKVGRGESSGCK